MHLPSQITPQVCTAVRDCHEWCPPFEVRGGLKASEREVMAVLGNLRLALYGGGKGWSNGWGVGDHELASAG